MNVRNVLPNLLGKTFMTDPALLSLQHCRSFAHLFFQIIKINTYAD